MRELFEQMVKEMRGEKHLLPHTSEDLFQQFLKGRSVIKIENDRIIGHVTLWPLIGEWFEFGNIWVPHDHRGRGLSKILFAEMLRQRPQIMLTTTNPVVFHLSEEFGMRHISFNDLPSGVHEATCICPPRKIRGCINPLHCPLKDTECRAYIQGS